jgi:RNA methyltransferase, TrmH family
MTPDVIRSRENPTFKYIRSLFRRDRRTEEQAFLVENPRVIRDALAVGFPPLLIACDETFDPGKLSTFSAKGGVKLLESRLMHELSDTDTPQGIVAVFGMPGIRPRRNGRQLTLVADGIQDPGNLGTLIRSAAGARCSAVYFTSGTVDPFSPKVVRSAAGAHFHIAIKPIAAPDFKRLSHRHSQVLISDSAGSISYDEANLSGDVIVVVGSEAKGVSPSWIDLASSSIAIPLGPGIESLNAAVAGSIILFEADRQFRKKEVR